jgi:hypothetical protein
MYYLLIDYNNNVDLRQKEPRLEEFREFYCNPQPPSLRDDENRAFYTWLSDEEWEKEKQEDNKKMIIFNEWEQKRKTEFYDIIQPALFRYLPGLNEIEKDYWVMYAVYLGDEYEIWKSLCENLEITIDFQMPPESVNWPIEEWRKMVHERYDTYGKESDEKRDTRIFGK